MIGNQSLLTVRKKARKVWPAILVLFVFVMLAAVGLPGSQDTSGDEIVYDKNLMEHGYYFESEQAAIEHFERLYIKSGSHRDLIDLCNCLYYSYAGNWSMSKKYYPILIELIMQQRVNVTRIRHYTLVTMCAEYALMISDDNKQDGRALMLHFAKAFPPESEHYAWFFIWLYPREKEDIEFEYELWQTFYSKCLEEYSDINDFYEQGGLYTIWRLEVCAKELGYNQEAEKYKLIQDEYKDLWHGYYYFDAEMVLQKVNDDIYMEHLKQPNICGYYFDTYQEAIAYLEEEYQKTKSLRDLADLCLCIKDSRSKEFDHYKQKYYPELFHKIDKYGFVMGVGNYSADIMYYDYIRLSHDTQTNFEQILLYYGKKSSNYPRVIDNMIKYALEEENHHIESMVILYNEGVRLIRQAEHIPKDELFRLRDLSHTLLRLEPLLGDNYVMDELELIQKKLRER